MRVYIYIYYTNSDDFSGHLPDQILCEIRECVDLIHHVFARKVGEWRTRCIVLRMTWHLTVAALGISFRNEFRCKNIGKKNPRLDDGNKIIQMVSSLIKLIESTNQNHINFRVPRNSKKIDELWHQPVCYLDHLLWLSQCFPIFLRHCLKINDTWKK